MTQRVGKECDVHCQHDEVAMGEVHHVHHAPDQRETGGKQGVHRPHQQTRDDDLEKYHAPRITLLRPALERQLELSGGARRWPDRHVVAALKLHQQRGGKLILALRIELDALVADHQLIGLQVGGD